MPSGAAAHEKAPCEHLNITELHVLWVEIPNTNTPSPKSPSVFFFYLLAYVHLRKKEKSQLCIVSVGF